MENQTPEQPPRPGIKPKKKGGANGFLFGCLIVAVVLVIVGVIGVRGCMSFFDNLIDEYTQETPRELPLPEPASQEDIKVLLDDVTEFYESLKEGRATRELGLSAQDLNLLIHNHPQGAPFQGHVFFRIENERLLGEVSAPLDEISERTRGKYINGTAGFRVLLKDDQLEVYLESLEVGGNPVPKAFLEGFSRENLARDINKDEEAMKGIRKLESIEIKDGRLWLVPKNLTQ